jgi:hypothetical protein
MECLHRLLEGLCLHNIHKAVGLNSLVLLSMNNLFDYHKEIKKIMERELIDLKLLKKEEVEKLPGGGAKVRKVTYQEVNEECPYLQLLNSLSEVEIYKSQIYSDETPMEHGNFFPYGLDSLTI